jgi:hypothetical protein
VEGVELLSRQVYENGRLPFCKKMVYNTIVGRKCGKQGVSVKTFGDTKNMIIIKEYILADILQTKGR